MLATKWKLISGSSLWEVADTCAEHLEQQGFDVRVRRNNEGLAGFEVQVDARRHRQAQRALTGFNPLPVINETLDKS